MGNRLKWTKTDFFLLTLTLLFLVCTAVTWLMTPRQVTGDYHIAANEAAEGITQITKVNINTAGVEELDGLPGIGPVLAQRIVDWREENGAFSAPEDLLQVEGIGRATLENLENCIVTEDTE